MQAAAIVILALLCAALTFRLVRMERNLRAASRQLWERERTGSSVHLRSAVSHAATEELLAAINGILGARELDAAVYRNQEKTIRSQIANVSHDLRTPLTSILGYLQLLEGDALGSEERKEYLSIVQSRARSLQTLITGFYDLSRLEGGEYPLTRESVDLGSTLSRLAAELYNDFAERDVEVTAEMEEGLPTVMADPGGVARVFANLLRNALEHGGNRLSIRLYREGDALVTTFQNDAPTLTQEDAAHLFERFYTADKMRTGQSTGLGLAIVKGLVERMGHQVGVELRDGTFTVKVRWRIAE